MVKSRVKKILAPLNIINSCSAKSVIRKIVSALLLVLIVHEFNQSVLGTNLGGGSVV